MSSTTVSLPTSNSPNFDAVQVPPLDTSLVTLVAAHVTVEHTCSADTDVVMLHVVSGMGVYVQTVATANPAAEINPAKSWLLEAGYHPFGLVKGLKVLRFAPVNIDYEMMDVTVRILEIK